LITPIFLPAQIFSARWDELFRSRGSAKFYGRIPEYAQPRLYEPWLNSRTKICPSYRPFRKGK